MCDHLNVASCDSLQFESFITQQQIMEEEPSDEWDFVDDSNLHKKDLNDARKRCEAIVQSDRNSEMLHDSSLMNLNPTALNQLWLEPPPNREQELTLKFARKGTSNCFLGESQEKGLCGKYSQNLMDLEREQDLYCGEYQRKSDFEGVKERESLVSDSQLKNKATLETPRSCSMSKFLSSMDDGKFDERKAWQVDGQMILLLDGKPYFYIMPVMIKLMSGVTRLQSQTKKLQNLQAMLWL